VLCAASTPAAGNFVVVSLALTSAAAPRLSPASMTVVPMAAEKIGATDSEAAGIVGHRLRDVDLQRARGGSAGREAEQGLRAKCRSRRAWWNHW